MARVFKTLLFFLLISTASVSAHAGSLFFSFGWYPVMPWGTSFFPWTYYGYTYRRAPLYEPVQLPNIPLTNSLMALGESKKEAWLVAQATKNAASPGAVFPPIKVPPEIPEIKIRQSSEFSMNSY